MTKCVVDKDDQDARLARTLFFLFSCGISHNIPNLFGSVTELTTGHTGTKTVVTDTDALILEGIGKVIMTLGHGTDEDGDTLIRLQRLQIIPGAHQRGLKTHGHLAAIGR